MTKKQASPRSMCYNSIQFKNPQGRGCRLDSCGHYLARPSVESTACLGILSIPTDHFLSQPHSSRIFDTLYFRIQVAVYISDIVGRLWFYPTQHRNHGNKTGAGQTWLGSFLLYSFSKPTIGETKKASKSTQLTTTCLNHTQMSPSGILGGGVKLPVSGTISTHAVHAKCAYGSSSVGLCQ